MAQTLSVMVSPGDRARLASIIGDRSRPLKHSKRARIILKSAEHLPGLEVTRLVQVSQLAVWLWQHY